MKTNIIEDLRSYYLKHWQKIHQLLGNEKMKLICDHYFKNNLNYIAISLCFDMTVSEVNNMMITACGLIIRNRHKIGRHA